MLPDPLSYLRNLVLLTDLKPGGNSPESRRNQLAILEGKDQKVRGRSSDQQRQPSATKQGGERETQAWALACHISTSALSTTPRGQSSGRGSLPFSAVDLLVFPGKLWLPRQENVAKCTG